MIVFIVALTSCEENDKMIYNDDHAIYFQLFDANDKLEVDSVLYSFATGTKKVDTVDLNVKVLGTAVDYDRFFNVKVVEEQTTAHVEKHYTAINEQYLLPAGEINASVPVILHNTDPLLNDSVLKITLEILNSDDFNVGYKDKLMAKLLFSDQLVEPASWNILRYFFGTYHEMKHRVFLEMYGIDFPEDAEEVKDNRELWNTYGSYVNEYFVENYPVYDDEGEIVEPWR